MSLDTSGRRIRITTPQGDDAFYLTGISGQEELSRPFSFHLDLVSDELAVDAASVINKPVSWTVAIPEDSPRQFHGLVRRFTFGPFIGRSLRRYSVEVVPWLWFLNLSTDCRIFQNLTAPDIVKKVFEGHGFSDFQFKLQKSYVAREYCVQYRESSFAFVSRLLEEEGICYWFTYSDSAHQLILSDTPSDFAPCDPHAKVSYSPELADAEVISTWECQVAAYSGKATMTDYDFKKPKLKLLSDGTSEYFPAFERYDYPSEQMTTAANQGKSKLRLEEWEKDYKIFNGASICSSFLPGATFKFEDAPSELEEGKNFVIRSVEHSASEMMVPGLSDGSADYRNTFTCLDAEKPFRPSRITPRTYVQGPQTAVVVGPAGEEIHTDSFGRVKVQFHWDRLGKMDDKSSCWIRVSEAWAGQAFGSIFLPRIGQEVIVDFLEGNPDSPIITGRVYNALQVAPYALPDNKTVSGIRSRSSPGGEGADCNELFFEDKKGSELITFHAQKDFSRSVENDDALLVEHDQTIEIKNDRTITVKEGNEATTIEKGNRTITVKEGDLTTKVEKGNEIVTIHTDRTITVETGNDSHTVTQGNREVIVEAGNDTLTIKSGNQTVKLNAGASSTEAAQSITLKVGSNSVKIDTSGVTISGMNIKIEGSAATAIKGLTTSVEASASLTLKGAIVQIN
ncbi:MAG: type VI secretion system tip protein VgrG [Planctomycetes bacterium]|nr:type VI secretion system tip protein VgrG [Planctomycetota bacterium]